MVYLWKKNGEVCHHTDLKAAALLADLTAAPDLTVSEADFEAAGGVARLVNGAVLLGKTDAEIETEENQRRIVLLKKLLADTDYIAAKIAEGSASIADYADKIAQRQTWRQEIAALSGE